MNGEHPTPSSRNPAVPVDFAEWLGAVRLTHLVLDAVQTEVAPPVEFRLGPGRTGYSFRMLLTLLSYAYARGIYGSDEIEERVRVDADLRYLCAHEFPEAQTLRHFRRREWPRLQAALTKVLGRATGSEARDPWFDAGSEAAARLEGAAAADSLALDC